MSMHELGLDIEKVRSWFRQEQDAPYKLIRVSDEVAAAWADALGVAVRRCYVADSFVVERAAHLGRAPAEIVASKLPDAGSTMAGDFGEIVVYCLQAASEHPDVPLGVKKWRLKERRTKPAPLSDVVHLVLPTWPVASEADRLLCAEVKTKATDGKSTPIKDAMEHIGKDRTSRLADTLVWLRERALGEDIGVEIAQLARFINATEHPQAERRFSAVAVVCESLLGDELADAPQEPPSGYSLLVVVVPRLHGTYTDVFAAAHQSAAGLAVP